jgi:hypothetical protein
VYQVEEPMHSDDDGHNVRPKLNNRNTIKTAPGANEASDVEESPHNLKKMFTEVRSVRETRLKATVVQEIASANKDSVTVSATGQLVQGS